MAENIKRELRKKTTGTKDVKRNDQKATVSIGIKYPDTSSPTSDWSEMVDKIFKVVAEVIEEFEQQTSLPLEDPADAPGPEKGIGGDGERE